MRALNKLTAARVKNSAPGKYSDGGGLWLHKRADGCAQWFLRVTVYGRRREMGLGSLLYVSLKEAREEAAKWRAVARQGKDPVKEREKDRRLAARADHTLATVAEEAFEARKAELKGDGNEPIRLLLRRRPRAAVPLATECAKATLPHDGYSNRRCHPHPLSRLRHGLRQGCRSD